MGACMLGSVASAIRESFAHAIVRCSQTGRQSELIALAWTLRNRAQLSRGGVGDAKSESLNENDARKLASGLLSDMGLVSAAPTVSSNGNGHAEHTHGDTTLQQAMACVALVFDGLVPDPTHGASRVHRHDEEPSWANDCEATALIGPLLFFRECYVDTRSEIETAAAYSDASK